MRNEILFDNGLFKTGEGRMAPLSFSAPDTVTPYQSVFFKDLLHHEIPYGVFRHLLDEWTGGREHDGIKPHEYFIKGPIILEGIDAGLTTHPVSLDMSTAIGTIMNPQFGAKNDRAIMPYLETVYCSGIRLAEDRRLQNKTSNWAIVLPNNIKFNSGVNCLAQLDIAEIECSIGLNMWRPPNIMPSKSQPKKVLIDLGNGQKLELSYPAKDGIAASFRPIGSSKIHNYWILQEEKKLSYRRKDQPNPHSEVL